MLNSIKYFSKLTCYFSKSLLNIYKVLQALLNWFLMEFLEQAQELQKHTRFAVLSEKNLLSRGLFEQNFKRQVIMDNMIVKVWKVWNIFWTFNPTQNFKNKSKHCRCKQILDRKKKLVTLPLKWKKRERNKYFEKWKFSRLL